MLDILTDLVYESIWQCSLEELVNDAIHTLGEGCTEDEVWEFCLDPPDLTNALLMGYVQISSARMRYLGSSKRIKI